MSRRATMRKGGAGATGGARRGGAGARGNKSSGRLDGADLLAKAMARAEGQRAAKQMVELVINQGVQLLQQHEMQERAHLLTAQQAVHNSVDAVAMQLLMPDPGEVACTPMQPGSVDGHFDYGDMLRSRAGGEPFQLWVCEPEPEPCPVDRLAQGSVPCDNVPQDTAFYVPATTSNTTTGTRRSGSRRGGAGTLLMSPGRRSRRTPRTHTPAVRTTHSTAAAGPGTADEVHSAAPSRRGAGKNVSFRINIPPTQQARLLQEVRVRELREIARRKEAEAASTRRLEEARQARENLARIKRMLRGRNHTFDANGNIVLVSAVRAGASSTSSHSHSAAGGDGAAKPSARIKVRDGDESDEWSSSDEGMDPMVERALLTGKTDELNSRQRESLRQKQIRRQQRKRRRARKEREMIKGRSMVERKEPATATTTLRRGGGLSKTAGVFTTQLPPLVAPLGAAQPVMIENAVLASGVTLHRGM